MINILLIAFLAISCNDGVKIVEKFSLPIKEISGICFKDDVLHLVSDREDFIYMFDWSRRQSNQKLTKIDLKEISGQNYGGQWESIYCHKDGRLSLLQESTSLLITLNSNHNKIEKFLKLKTQSDKSFNKEWEKEENSKGEGLVYLPNKKYLVVKEKKPVQLILFDIEDKLEKVWRIEPSTKKRVKDISEIAFNGSKLFFVSDKSNLIGEISQFAGNDEHFIIKNIKELPEEIEKVEGLSFSKSGQTVIAIDSKSISDSNVFVID